MSKRKRKNVGLWADRLNSNNPREQAFADAWEAENERVNETGAIVGALLYGHGHSNVFACDSTCQRVALGAEHQDRDRVVAATIIQWLGSNVGFSFLETALNNCGYKVCR